MKHKNAELYIISISINLPTAQGNAGECVCVRA